MTLEAVVYRRYLHLTTTPSLIKSQNVIPGISDHEMVVVDSDIRPVFNPPKPRKIYSYQKADWDKMKDEMREFNRRYLKKCDQRSVDQNWSNLRDQLHHLLDKYVPSKLKSTRQNLPWLTPELRRLTKKKQRMYNKARKSKKAADWDLYKRFKKHLQNKIKDAHRQYTDKILSEAFTEGNNKPFWSYIKSRRKDSGGIAPLMKDGQLISGGQEKAEILNQQFCSVFTRDKQDEVQKLTSPRLPDIEPLNITIPGVEKLLSKVVVSKASGPDNIPNQLLKELATEIAPPLTQIFNQTLRLGQLPTDWKMAHITPIFKKDDKHSPANYRPVSLTCVCSKLMEDIVVKHLLNHIDRYNILSDLQHA